MDHINPAEGKGPGLQIVFPESLRPNMIDFFCIRTTLSAPCFRDLSAFIMNLSFDDVCQRFRTH